MKNARSLLLSLLTITVNSSCALGYGQRRCDAPIIPPKPPQELCIASSNGTAICTDQVTHKIKIVPVENFVCQNVSDYLREVEWIDAVLRSIDP